MDAYRLKENPIFRFESIANLFSLVNSCNSNGAGGGHSITTYLYLYKFLTKSEICNKIDSVNMLNNIYTAISKPRIYIEDEMDNYSTADFEFWANDELYKKRQQVYLEVYNRIKR
jgi:hypothetical protein